MPERVAGDGSAGPGQTGSDETLPDWDGLVLVGRIARPHGLRGQVAVNPETDFVEDRFEVGAAFWTRRDGRVARLTVEETRVQGGRPIVRFTGIGSVDEAAGMAGLELRIPESELRPLGEGLYYHHELVGCVVTNAATSGVPAGEGADDGDATVGSVVGTVVKVEGGAGGSILVVAGERGEVLIPLAADICVEVDVAARSIRVDAPEGLLDLNETRRSRAGSGEERRSAPRP